MKPLTVEELKALEVGDWVWIVDKAMNLTHYRQKNHHDTTHCLFERCINDMALNIFRWEDYGKTWIAYKNKEQAEIEEKCIICHMSLSNILPKVDRYGNRYCNGCYEAKCKVENIKLTKQAECKDKTVELSKGREMSEIQYSNYCIKECPIGKPITENYLKHHESIWDAVYDTRFFIDNCKKKGCKYQKERESYDLDNC